MEAKFDELEKLRRLKELEDLKAQAIPESGFTHMMKQMGSAAVSGLTGPVNFATRGGVAFADAMAGGRPDTAQAQEAVTIPNIVEPKSKADEYVQRVVSGVTDPTNLLGGSGVVRNAITGGIAGAGGVAGQTMGEQSGHPTLGAVLGSLAGGATGGLLTNPPLLNNNTTLVKMAHAMLGREPSGLPGPGAVDGMALRTAARSAIEDQSNGLDMILSQYLPRTSVAHEVDRLAADPNAQNITAMLDRQPKQVANYAIETVEGLPGRTLERQDAANNAADLLTQSIAKERQNAVNEFKKKLVPGFQMNPAIMAEAEGKLSALRDTYDKQPGAQAIIDDALESFRPTAQPSGTPAGSILGPNSQPLISAAPSAPAYFTDPAEFNIKLKTALSGEGKNTIASGTADRVDSRAVAQVREIIGQMYDKAGGGIKEANAAMSQYMKDKVEPLKQFLSPMVGQQGYSDIKNSSEAAFKKVFTTGSESNVVNPRLEQLGKHMNAMGPDGAAAFRDLFKSHLNAEVQNAIKDAEKGTPAYQTGTRVSNAFGSIGDPQGKRNQMALRVIFEGLGKSPDEVRQAMVGFQRAQKTLLAASNMPPKITNVPTGDLKQTLPGGAANAALEMQATTPAWALSKIDKFRNWAYANKFMDEVITDPKRVEQLIKLGRQGVWDRELEASLITIREMGKSVAGN